MFFFPFSDDIPTKNKPYVTYCIIGICCFISLWQFTLPPQLFESAVYNFGVVPVSVVGRTEEIIQTLLEDKLPKPGSAKNRKNTAPEKGKTTLLEVKNA